jgi:hypothetical protein
VNGFPSSRSAVPAMTSSPGDVTPLGAHPHGRAGRCRCRSGRGPRLPGRLSRPERGQGERGDLMDLSSGRPGSGSGQGDAWLRSRGERKALPGRRIADWAASAGKSHRAAMA